MTGCGPSGGSVSAASKPNFAMKVSLFRECSRSTTLPVYHFDEQLYGEKNCISSVDNLRVGVRRHVKDLCESSSLCSRGTRQESASPRTQSEFAT